VEVGDPDAGVEDFGWRLQPATDVVVSADATSTPAIIGR
jgi:hypothetical protein